MSEPLFTIYDETFLLDYPPNDPPDPLTYTDIPKTYIIIKNGETKYRLYLINSVHVQLTSEDNKHLIQSGDIIHKYLASQFIVGANDILERDEDDGDDGLQQNELVIDGHDLYNPFTVQGLADVMNDFIA